MPQAYIKINICIARALTTKENEITFTVTKVAGIRPIKVADKNMGNGMSTMGEATLMKVFGSVGVTLRKSM